MRVGKPVPTELVGTSKPSVWPGDDPTLYGTAVLEGPQAVEVRSYQTFRLTYSVGRLGLDDTGAIRIAFRIVTDAGAPQITDPAQPNYVSAECSGQGRIHLRIGPEGPRPWNQTITAELRGGYLAQGDQIVVTMGDTRHGSAGMLMQTFVEEGYEFRVMTDVQATGNYLPLAQQFAVAVVPGPGAVWRAVLPTLRSVGAPFRLGLKAEDRYGNPTDQAKGRVRFETSLPVEGLPESLDYAPKDRAMAFEGLRVTTPGTLRIKVFVDDDLVCEAGPLILREGAASYWGDLHGQTGETVGVNTIESYFDFARNKAFLDVSAHQGNDFQINAAFWAKLNDLTAKLNDPGVFTVFPGYEWSGNTAIGGDHNVFYATEGRPIYRCSHALLEDRTEIDRDAHTLTDLYARLKDEDAVVYAHVGGRYCNLDYDHDPVLETAVEVHSAWGTFEWVLTDALALGRRVGVVCNSDGHKGRPGASYPGASTFGAYGGLTCFLAATNDRPSIMEAQRRRHHYGTTGCRLHLEVSCRTAQAADLSLRNLPDAETHTVRQGIMGDILRVRDATVEIDINVQAHCGILRVELRDGAEVLETIRPYDASDLGNRLRVTWEGAAYRGRGRDVRWQGRAIWDAARLRRIQSINALNPETLLEPRGSQSVIWRGVTTGNFMGFDAWLDAGTEGRLNLTTNQVDADMRLADLEVAPWRYEAGGLGKALVVQRLPEEPLQRDMSLSRQVTVRAKGDTPIWVCVVTEDGHQAWSSPIYLRRS